MDLEVSIEESKKNQKTQERGHENLSPDSLGVCN